MDRNNLNPLVTTKSPVVNILPHSTNNSTIIDSSSSNNNLSNLSQFLLIPQKQPPADSIASQIPKAKLPNVSYPSSLRDKLIGDVLIGTSITLGVAPFISVIDKAIVESASGSKTLVRSGLDSISNIIRNPVGFARSPMFLVMWGTYAVTYNVANSLKTLTEHYDIVGGSNHENKQGLPHEETPISDRNSTTSAASFGIFFGTFAVNSAASLMKDKVYAKMFGKNSTSPIPKITYGLWASRDMMVIGSSFILPDIMSKKLQDNSDMDKQKAKSISQIFCPIAVQFAAGPVQLLGLDIYNRPMRNKSLPQVAMERASFIASGFSSVVMARILRIAPAYGLGGVFNTHYRDQWRDMLLDKELHNQSIEQAPWLIDLSVSRN